MNQNSNSRGFQQKVISFIRKRNLLNKNDKVLIALSGGADSIALALVLNKIVKSLMGITVIAAHFNHGLRDSESDRDQLFCKNFCKDNNIPFFTEKEYIKKQKGESLEEIAREKRYGFLNKIATEENCNCIATGHHMDDQAETVLMRMLKGTGVEGLKGIRIKNGTVIRPLLDVLRKDIILYLGSENCSFIEDSSNTDIKFLRNKIRKQLVPYLEENYNPSVKRALAAFAQNFQISDINKNASLIMLEQISKTEIRLNISDINIKENISGFRTSLLIAIDKLKAKAPTKDLLEDIIEKVVLGKSGTTLELANGYLVSNIYGYLHLYKKSVVVPLNVLYAIKGGIYQDDFLRITSTFFDLDDKEESIKFPLFDSDTGFFDLSKISNNLIIRNVENGDRIKQLGSKGTKKISDVFTDLKIPRQERNKKLVIESDGKIVWLLGCRISQDFAVTKKTKKILSLRIENITK